MAIVPLPLTSQLSNGTTADASQVMADLNAIANAVNTYGASQTDLTSATTTLSSQVATNLSARTGDAGSVSIRNYLINGGAGVAQKTATVTLTTSAKYGQVDQCAMWASGGSVSAGTLTQNTSATVGRTGNAARAAGVTLTGSGQISWRYRVESVDAVNLKNQSGSFQIMVMHDVGISVNYTIIIRKPTASDNYASTTVISTSSAIPVASGTATQLTAPGISLGDVSNGIEIEIQAACGAITTKNFDFTEWQLEEGDNCTTFVRRLYEEELRNCRRYLPTYVAGGSSEAVCAGQAISTTSSIAWFPFEVEPRIIPTGITTTGAFSVLNSAGGFITATNMAFSSSSTGKKAGGITVTVASGLTGGNAAGLYSTTGTILFTGCQL